MSKAKRIVLAALLPLLAMACVVLAFFAQAPVTRAQAAEGLTVTVDEERLESEPLYARTATTDQIKTYLTVQSADGLTKYQPEEYNLSGTILAGACEFTVSLRETPSVTGTVTVYITPQQPKELVINFVGDAISSTASSQDLKRSSYISGYVRFNDAATESDTEDIFEYSNYLTVEDVDLRPLGEAYANVNAGQIFHVDVDFTFAMNGGEKTVTLSVPVKAAKISSISAEITGEDRFEALQPLPSESLTVAVFYTGVMMPRVLSPGEYEIVYIDEPGVEDRTDVLEYGDTYVQIVYREGAQEVEPFTLRGFTVTAAPVDAPSLISSVDSEYSGQEKSYVFSVFNELAMTCTVTEEDEEDEATTEVVGNTIVVSATNAGKYTVRFETLEGFYWRSSFIPNGAVPVREDPSDEESAIIAFEYTIEITKASLQSASFEISGGWTYLDTVAAPGKESVTVLNRRGETVNLDTEGATVTYTYVNADGTPAYNSGTLPTKAGTYTVSVSVTNLNNYTDLTGAGTKTFTISPRAVELPTLEEGTDSVPYTGQGQSSDL